MNRDFACCIQEDKHKCVHYSDERDGTVMICLLHLTQQCQGQDQSFMSCCAGVGTSPTRPSVGLLRPCTGNSSGPQGSQGLSRKRPLEAFRSPDTAHLALTSRSKFSFSAAMQVSRGASLTRVAASPLRPYTGNSSGPQGSLPLASCPPRQQPTAPK